MLGGSQFLGSWLQNWSNHCWCWMLHWWLMYIQTDSQSALQAAINIVSHYARRYRVLFNADKTKIVVTGSKHDMDYFQDIKPRYLNDETINEVSNRMNILAWLSLVFMRNRKMLTITSLNVETHCLVCLVQASPTSASSPHQFSSICGGHIPFLYCNQGFLHFHSVLQIWNLSRFSRTRSWEASWSRAFPPQFHAFTFSVGNCQ